LWYNVSYIVAKKGVNPMPAAEFSGNYTHNIDPKGRVTIPAAYREALGYGFTIGLNNEFNAIALYPIEKWQDMSARLDRIPDSDVRGMAYVRLIKAYSFTDQQLDGQGRLLLPQTLRKKTGAEKDIRLVGVGQYLEVWDEAKFVETCEKSELELEELMAYVNDRYFAGE